MTSTQGFTPSTGKMMVLFSIVLDIYTQVFSDWICQRETFSLGKAARMAKHKLIIGLTQSKISPHPSTLLRQVQDIASPAGEGAQNSNFSFPLLRERG